MARSKKKPIVKYCGHAPTGKKFANRAVRNTELEEVASGKGYKKVFNSYNISDVRSDMRFDSPWLRERMQKDPEFKKSIEKWTKKAGRK